MCPFLRLVHITGFLYCNMIYCCGLTPANIWTLRLSCLLPSPAGQAENRRKTGRLVDWDKVNLIGEAKSVPASKEKKEFIHYFQLAGKCLATSWKVLVLTVAWKDKHHDHKGNCCKAMPKKEKPEILPARGHSGDLFSIINMSYSMQNLVNFSKIKDYTLLLFLLLASWVSGWLVWELTSNDNL